jgi:hypothetical protein
MGDINDSAGLDQPINKNLEGPAPGKELEPDSKSFCAARPELNTIAERANIFAAIPFGLVKNDQTGFPPTVARPRSEIANAK